MKRLQRKVRRSLIDRIVLTSFSFSPERRSVRVRSSFANHMSVGYIIKPRSQQSESIELPGTRLWIGKLALLKSQSRRIRARPKSNLPPSSPPTIEPIPCSTSFPLSTSYLPSSSTSSSPALPHRTSPNSLLAPYLPLLLYLPPPSLISPQVPNT